MRKEAVLSYELREELIKKIGSLYKLVVLAARRAAELGAGAEKLVETPLNEKPTSVALQEIAAGKVSLKIKEEK